MKLYLISQEVNTGYDTYDSAVVAAENEDAARRIMPGGWQEWGSKFSSWAYDPSQVEVRYLGEAAPEIEAGEICASFNAG